MTEPDIRTRPDIRVEKGNARPEETAAVTAVLLARAAGRRSSALAPARPGRDRAGQVPLGPSSPLPCPAQLAGLGLSDGLRAGQATRPV